MIDSVKKWYNTNVAVNDQNKINKTTKNGVTVYTNTTNNPGKVSASASASSFSIKDAFKRGAIDTSIEKIRREIDDFQEIIRLNQELISDYQNGGPAIGLGAIAEKAAATALSVAYSEVRTDILKIRKLADTFASNMDDPDGGEAISNALEGLIDAIMGLLNPLNAIGFPELPIIGNLGELLKKIRRIKETLTPEVKAAMAEERKKNKESGFKLTNLIPRDLILDVQSITEDVKTICNNLQLIPTTLLGMAIMVLVNAVSDIFDTIGLGMFDFEGLMKASPLKFGLDFSVLPDIALEAPNWTTLEALAQCIPMILMAVTNLPGMVASTIKNFLGDICSLITGLDVLTQQTDDKVMIAKLEVDNLSCSKNIECDNMRIDYLSLKKTLSELETQKKYLSSAQNDSQSKVTELNDLEKNPTPDPIKVAYATQELYAISSEADRIDNRITTVNTQIGVRDKEISKFKEDVEKLSVALSTYMSVPAKNITPNSQLGERIHIKVTEKAWEALSATMNKATDSQNGMWKTAVENAKLSWQAGTKL